MPELTTASYRADPAVPRFDESRPLFVFDGVCVLCSGGASWLMRHDKQGRVRFTPAQEPLGRALFEHYGIALDDSYLLIADGRALPSRAAIWSCAGSWVAAGTSSGSPR